MERPTPPMFSIIIPVRRPNADLRACLAACAQLEGASHEVIVVPDEPWSDDVPSGVHVVASGAAGPGAKRDLAAAQARGEILAFLDDDTLPEPAWLRCAARYFADPTVVAVGGPAVTSRTDSFMQQASGYVYESLLGGGPYAYRYRPHRQRDVDDYPTCNLLVRRAAFLEVGGFDTAFWPGEDTKLCHDLVHGLGGRIVYAPDVVVEHHRRPLFGRHLAQVRNYALHRGYFVKRLPATSARPSYFVPSALVVAGMGGLLAATRSTAMRRAMGLGSMLYLAGVAADALAVTRRRLLWPLVAAGIIATHVVYGIYFLLGLAQGRLPEE